MSNLPAQPSLFGIPIELRLRIYEYLLNEKPLPSQAVILPNPRLYQSQPGVARTCHQAHAEIKQHEKTILLKTSTFKFRDLADLNFIVSNASVKTLALVSSVHIGRLRYRQWSLIPNCPKALVREQEKLAILSSLPKLEHLCIEVGNVDRAKGPEEADCWMQEPILVRDRHYQQVVDDVTRTLPNLPSGVLLEVQCSMNLMADSGRTDREDRKVLITLRQGRDEQGAWGEMEVKESHDGYFLITPQRWSLDRKRRKGVRLDRGTLVRRNKRA